MKIHCLSMAFVDFFPVCRGRPRRGGRPIGHRGQESACRPDPLSDRRVAPGSEPSASTFEIKGLAPRTTAEVLGEQRRITIKEGRFEDHFRPYDVHLYAIATD